MHRKKLFLKIQITEIFLGAYLLGIRYPTAFIDYQYFYFVEIITDQIFKRHFSTLFNLLTKSEV